MGKVPTKRLSSDDCLVYINRVIEDGKVTNRGDPFAAHEGEWVEIIQVGSIRQYLALSKLASVSSNGNLGNLEIALNDLCKEVSQRIVDWNWTDMAGKAMPKPYRKPEIISELTEDELLWLIRAVQGETPGERKNELPPSGTNS